MTEFANPILVVDDEYSIRETSAAILRMKGYEVLTAEDGLAALEVLSKTSPQVLISDLRMPRMDGFELLAVVRQRFPEIAVIVITGQYVNASPSENLITDAFFAKGQYPREELFQTIAGLIEHYPVRQPHVHVAVDPIWIPRDGQDFVLTCTHCLRSFSVQYRQIAETIDVQNRLCTSCTRPVPFRLQQQSLRLVMRNKAQSSSS